MRTNAEFLPRFMANEAKIRAFIRTLVDDPQAVDDVFQEVALVLWQKFDLYDPLRPFDAWARGIVAKEVLVMRRGKARCPTPFPPDVVAAILDEFERFVASGGMTSERAEALERCVEGLPPTSQKMLQLRYGKSMSVKQVASLLGRAIAPTQRALSRIRKRLAECIERRMAPARGGER